MRSLAPPTSRILPLLLVVLATLGVAAPAQGATFPTPAFTSVSLGEFKFKKYTARVSAFKQGGKTSMTLAFDRKRGGSSQSHFFTFKKGVSLKVSRNLSSGRLKARGKFGKVSLKFGNAGALDKAGPDKGCTGGRSKSRKGRVSGTVSVSADRGYFRKIKRRRAKATVFSVAKGKCKVPDGGGPNQPRGPVTLTAQGANGLSLFVFKKGGKAEITASTFKGGENHSITVRAPASAFTFAPDYKSATVKGSGPFASGAASFTADSACPPSSASGMLAGNLGFKFDSGGAKRPFETARTASLFKSGETCVPPPTPPPPNQAPTAGFSFSDTGNPFEVSFTDGSFDDSGVTGYLWNFGDGTGSTEQNPTHVFPDASPRQVTLSVRDSDGATDSVTETVTPSP